MAVAVASYSGGRDSFDTVSDMKVSVLAYNGIFDSGLAAVLDVLDTANRMRDALDRPPPGWEVTTVAPGRRARTGAGHIVHAAALDAAQDADLLIVPALNVRHPEELIEFIESAPAAPLRRLIARVRARGIPVYTACSGTFLLAESGVLGGCRVTTTWWLTPAFRARYPEVDLDQTRMVISSDGVTTAGAAFGHVDLALALVRASSPALADLISSYLIVDERPSQSAYTIPSALAQSDPAVATFERWVRDRLAEPISIPEAARAMGVSERTLQRATQRVLGTSPVRFVQDMRVEQAAHLLRSTDLSLEAISRQVGYEHANTLRILLRERTGQTTRTLRGKTAAPA
jgi:transcriptional regulator GlxA family with amidase domain